jgi:hypothetical protein
LLPLANCTSSGTTGFPCSSLLRPSFLSSRTY